MSNYKPAHYNAVSPYLIVESVDKMIQFLTATFNAELVDKRVNVNGQIQHAALKMDDSILMLGERSKTLPTSTHVYVADVDACYQRALQAGASSVSEPIDREYGDRSAGVMDMLGNYWWLGTHQG